MCVSIICIYIIYNIYIYTFSMVLLATVACVIYKSSDLRQIIISLTTPL